MKNYLYILFIGLSILLQGQTAPSYYQNTDLTLEGNELKQALSYLISSTHDYTVSYNELWSILQQTDLDPDNTNNVLLIYGWDDNNSDYIDDYSRNKYATCGNGNACTNLTWNREHVYPRSLDGSNSHNSGPTADPHMLRASDVAMNGRRDNRLFAGGSGVASYITSNGDFFPGDNWKGDVARIIMYMYVRYGNQWHPNFVGVGSNSYHQDMPDIFLQWNAEDPVSEYEINRNIILEPIQGNRNPFIDNPYLATIIWGGPEAENTWPETLSVSELVSKDIIQVYPNPTYDYINISGTNSENQIGVYNIHGQLIKVLNNENKVHLPEQGMYIIQVKDGNEKTSFKVIRK